MRFFPNHFCCCCCCCRLCLCPTHQSHFTQRPDSPSWKRGTFSRWQNGKLPSIVSSFFGKEEKLLGDYNLRPLSLAACTSLSISRAETRHCTRWHPTKMPKHVHVRSSNPCYQYGTKPGCTRGFAASPNSICTGKLPEAGLEWFSMSRLNGSTVISGFPSSCACN